MSVEVNFSQFILEEIWCKNAKYSVFLLSYSSTENYITITKFCREISIKKNLSFWKHIWQLILLPLFLWVQNFLEDL